MHVQQERNGSEHVRTIDPELLLQRLRTGQRLTILDVRNSEEFRGPLGRIAGACSIPIHQLAARCEEFACHRTELVVVVSTRGHRSRLAGLELELAGFNEVRSLEGGVQRWIELGLPVVHATIPPEIGLDTTNTSH
jgi:sulfur dioxygenase